MTRECHVRFCERLGVRLPGATLPLGTSKPSPNRPNDSAVYINRGSVNLISFPELSFTRKSRFPHGLRVITWDS